MLSSGLRRILRPTASAVTASISPATSTSVLLGAPTTTNVLPLTRLQLSDLRHAMSPPSSSSVVNGNGGHSVSSSSSGQSPSLPRGRPITIVVEGNIGAGKTTFLRQFEASSPEDVEIVAEPVDKWRNVRGHNLLQLLYEDPKRWGFLFQSYVQLTMLQEHSKPCDKSLRLMERSLLSARFCFTENLFQHSQLTGAEEAVLSEYFDHLTSDKRFQTDVDLIVYLRTEPEVALSRVRNRARSEEKGISLEFLKDLHELHEDWLVRKTKFQPLQAPVMIIDANEDLKTLQNKYQNHNDTILEEVHKKMEGGQH